MLRQVIEDDNVTNSIDIGCRSSNRLRDAWEALIWLLARKPEIGQRLGFGDGVRIHKQASTLIPCVPDTTVLYEYDDNIVEIRDVKLTCEDI
jgi:hypothetical protein